MPRDGNGNYELPNPAVVTLTTIESADENDTRDDIAAALTQSASRDGQTIITGNWNFGAKRITNLANPVNAQDAVTKAYVDGGAAWALIGDTAATAVANIDFTWTAGDYRAIQVFVQGVLPASASATANLLMRARRSGAWLTGASDYTSLLLSYSTAGSFVTDLAANAWVLTRDGTNVSLDTASATLSVDPGGTGVEPAVTGSTKNSGDTLGRLGHSVTCAIPAEGAIDGLRILWEGGLNFAATGRIVVLGLKSSAAVTSSITLSDLATYDLPFDFGEGLPPSTAATNTLSVRVAREIIIPADFTGSVGGCGVNPTAQADFDITLNGVTIGTASISSLGVATFVSATPGVPVTCAVDDVIAMSAPVPADATLETVTFTIAAYRSL
jgi:hypothetical protein